MISKLFWILEFSCLIKGFLSDFTLYTGAILNCAGKDPVFWFLVGSGNRFLQTSKKPKLKSGNPVITSANKNKSKNFQLCCIFKTGFFSRKWKWLWFMKWPFDLTKHFTIYLELSLQSCFSRQTYKPFRQKQPFSLSVFDFWLFDKTGLISSVTKSKHLRERFDGAWVSESQVNF